MDYKILIADDEPVVLKSTELFLKKEFPDKERSWLRYYWVPMVGMSGKEMFLRLCEGGGKLRCQRADGLHRGTPEH